MSVPHPQQPQYYGNYAPPPPQKPPVKRGLAIAALITAGIAFFIGWIPIFGAIVGVVAIFLGIGALVRGQNKVLSVVAIAAGSLAVITSVVVTIIISVGNGQDPVAAPGQTSAPAAPAESEEAEPEPAPTVDETPTPSTEPTPTPTPTEEPGPDLAAFQPLDERAYALLARDPDAHIGDQLILTGVVTQFDAATGRCTFRANTGHTQMESSFDYGQNALFMSGDGSSDCPVLDDVVQDDHVRLWVEALGSFSYDTQIGGSTTVPSFEVLQVEQLPRQEY